MLELFVFCHEIGHLILDHCYKEENFEKEHEQQANRLAFDFFIKFNIKINARIKKYYLRHE